MKDYFKHATKGWGWWDDSERRRIGFPDVAFIQHTLGARPNHDERRRWRNAASEYVRTGLDQRLRHAKIQLDKFNPSEIKDANLEGMAASLLREFVAGMQYLPRTAYVVDWRVRLELLPSSPTGSSLCVHIVDAVLDAEGSRRG